jgi:ATP-dependent RNA helicase RhlE
MNKVRTSRGSFAKRNSSNFRSQGNNRTFGPRNNNRGRAKGVSSVDIHAFIQKATRNNEVVEKVEIMHKFADFPFANEIKTNLNKKGYAVPTPIQDQAILPIMEGRDLIGLAKK